jgi:hypothetical protein
MFIRRGEVSRFDFSAPLQNPNKNAKLIPMGGLTARDKMGGMIVIGKWSIGVAEYWSACARPPLLMVDSRFVTPSSIPYPLSSILNPRVSLGVLGALVVKYSVPSSALLVPSRSSADCGVRNAEFGMRIEWRHAPLLCRLKSPCHAYPHARIRALSRLVSPGVRSTGLVRDKPGFKNNIFLARLRVGLPGTYQPGIMRKPLKFRHISQNFRKFRHFIPPPPGTVCGVFRNLKHFLQFPVQLGVYKYSHTLCVQPI